MQKQSQSTLRPRDTQLLDSTELENPSRSRVAEITASVNGNARPFRSHSSGFQKKVGLENMRRKKTEIQALQKALNIPKLPSLLNLSKPLHTNVPTHGLPNYSFSQHEIFECKPQTVDAKGSYALLQERNMEESWGPLNSTFNDIHGHNVNNELGNQREMYSADVLNKSLETPLFHESHGWDPGRVDNSQYRPRMSESPLMQQSHVWNPGGSGGSVFDGTLRSSLDDSNSRRNILLDKLKDAHVTIQDQNEKLTISESEVMNLREQLQNMETQQKIYHKELETLQLERREMDTRENKATDYSKSMLARINHLEKEFRSLSITHNALVLESKKKECVLDQTSLNFTVLEEQNRALQQRNSQLINECRAAAQQIQDARAAQQHLLHEKRQAMGEAAKAVQDHERASSEINTLTAKNMEAMKILKEERNKTRKLEQQMMELRMTSEFEASKLSLVADEVSHLQETCRDLRTEKEQILKDKLASERDVRNIDQKNTSLEVMNEILKGEMQRQDETRKILEEGVRALKNEKQQLIVEGKKEEERLVADNFDLKEQLESAQDNLERESRALRIKFTEEQERFKRELQQAKERAEKLSEEKQKLEGRCQELDKQLQLSRFSTDLRNGASASNNVQDTRNNNELRRQIEQLLIERSTYAASVQELKSHLASVEDENIRVKLENEENKELLKLSETEKSMLEREQHATSKRHEDENSELKNRIQDAWEQIGALNGKTQQQTEAMKRLLDVAKNTRKDDSEANIMEDSTNSEKESIRDQLTQNLEECNSLREQLDSTQQEHQRLMCDNRRLTDELNDTRRSRDQLQKDVADFTNENEILSSRVQKAREKEQQSRSVKNVQEELKHIKGVLSRLDKSKAELMTELECLRHEKALWGDEKAELLMSQAELEAENQGMRLELREHAKKDLLIADHASHEGDPKRKEYTASLKATEEATKELQSVRSELDKVWNMLRDKDSQLESQTKELTERENQLNRLADEATELKKDFAEMATKSSSRNQVISILRDQLMNKTNENAELQEQMIAANEELEASKAKYEKLQRDLSSSGPDISKWLDSQRSALQAERDMLKTKNIELECKLKEITTKESNMDDQSPFPQSQMDLASRRRSDGSLRRSIGSHSDTQLGGVSKDLIDELRLLKQHNSLLKSRLDELFSERDAALQDSQDLREGMQQLKEAFEEEIERELELERERFEKEKEEILKEKEKDSTVDGITSTDEIQQLREEKESLEIRRKNLEFERDELRRQIEELCENRAGSEEKGIQADLSTPSPRRRENRTRKRSASVGFITPIITINEVLNVSTDNAPLTSSPRRLSIDSLPSSFTPSSPPPSP